MMEVVPLGHHLILIVSRSLWPLKKLPSRVREMGWEWGGVEGGRGGRGVGGGDPGEIRQRHYHLLPLSHHSSNSLYSFDLGTNISNRQQKRRKVREEDRRKRYQSKIPILFFDQ